MVLENAESSRFLGYACTRSSQGTCGRCAPSRGQTSCRRIRRFEVDDGGPRPSRRASTLDSLMLGSTSWVGTSKTSRSPWRCLKPSWVGTSRTSKSRRGGLHVISRHRQNQQKSLALYGAVRVGTSRTSESRLCCVDVSGRHQQNQQNQQKSSSCRSPWVGTSKTSKSLLAGACLGFRRLSV